MPQVKSVKSLTEICTDIILEYQNIFCDKIPLGELENIADSLDSDKPTVNLFDDLPSNLLEELIGVLRKKESSESYPYQYKVVPFLKLLMNPRLRTLDLTEIDKESNISDVIHLATIRSPNLETLRLDYTTSKYIENFNFIPKFVKLRILEISFPEAGDDCFHLIGKHCPALRELHCIGCQATDDGILKLCVDGNCKSIHKLNVERCNKITTKGIQIALDNLPQLRVLCHESLLECLAEIAQNAIDKKLALPKYSLSELYLLEKAVYKSFSLQQSVLLCPNVREVYLTMWRRGLKDNDLSSLLSLEKLYTFEITRGIFNENLTGERTVEFDEDLSFDGVIPLLKKFGLCLKKLVLRCFVVVDIAVIIEFCPNLESLTLDCCKTKQSAETKVERPKLQKLTKFILDHSTITSENLFTLLSSPSLSYIELSMSYCNALTDDILQRAAKIHSFRNLECLHLYHCKLVTKKGIDIFLHESNPLKEIVLYFFNNSSRITKEDLIDWNNNPIWVQKNWQFNFILACLNKNIYLGGHIWEGPEGIFA